MDKPLGLGSLGCKGEGKVESLQHQDAALVSPGIFIIPSSCDQEDDYIPQSHCGPRKGIRNTGRAPDQ